LQPTLGRDNDLRGEHSATVNALQNQLVNLTPRRSDAGACFPCGGQESWSWTSLHTALKTIGVPTSFGSTHITAINSSQLVTASLSRWEEVVEIAAGQQATPYQKTEATLAPIIDMESHPVEAVPAE
jgi:hypothetical protein